MERIGELNSQQLERLPDQVRDSGKNIEVVAVDFCMNWLTTDRNRFYTMIMLSLDPALPNEAVAAKQKNLARIDDFIVRFGQVDTQMARKINSSVMGMMVSELMGGTAERRNVESFMSDFLKWKRSSVK